MLLYCDSCAEKYGYDIAKEKHSKGECGLCHIRLGPMNEMNDNDYNHLTNNISTDLFKAGGFQVRQIKSVPVGTIIAEICPTRPHKTIGHDCVAFFDKKKITLAHPSTGKRIEISF